MKEFLKLSALIWIGWIGQVYANPTPTVHKLATTSPSTEPTDETATPSLLDTGNVVNADFNKIPTYIKSRELTLYAKERRFLYGGGVEVKHGDMVLTADRLEGTYGEDNQIKQLVAYGNVVITRGATVRATGQKAVYDSASETVALTESPELMQDGSILAADTIRIFLREDRSTAEGAVRVKVAKEASLTDK